MNFQRTALKFAWQLCLPSHSAHPSLHRFAFNLARAQISNKYLWQKNNSQSDKIVWSANAQCPTHTHTRMHTQFVYIIAYTQPFTHTQTPTHTHTRILAVVVVWMGSIALCGQPTECVCVCDCRCVCVCGYVCGYFVYVYLCSFCSAFVCL